MTFAVIAAPHGDYTPPNQHPKVAAGMIERPVQISKCSNQAQLAAPSSFAVTAAGPAGRDGEAILLAEVTAADAVSLSPAQLDRLTGHKATIIVEERDHYQVDGDTVGECNTMIAEVLPGALTLRVPRATRVIGTDGRDGP